ncbi:MAG: hypothetical protein B6I31_03895 [Desulfobacteraceae bacterium 4572_19]|nr:MAG: hypothetical protein B6I31_03895 [Desulfobacteraceae bacterium 4572_19]
MNVSVEYYILIVTLPEMKGRFYIMASNDKHIKLRIIAVNSFLCLLFIATAARVIYLQAFKNKELSKIAISQHERNMETLGKRGSIYDTLNKKLAVSINAYSIGADIKNIKDPFSTAEKLANILNLNSKTLYKSFISKRQFVWIKRQVNPYKTAKIKAMKLPGICFSSDFCRYYPGKTLAAQVLGFAGIDGKGLEGLEFSFNSSLKGEEEKIKMIRDAIGQKFPAEQITPPDHAGNNIILTLDRTIQYITEKALAKAVQKYKAKSGIAVVMDPDTGALLAIAHYPLFNPNTYRSYDRERWRNRAITDPFEPGSTMKIFLAATALESGLCLPNTTFFCENGSYRIGKDIVNDVHPHDWLTLEEIIKFSSNIGAVKIAEVTGKKRLYNMLKAFGFGNKTNIECPGETAGLLAPSNKWAKIDTGAISFGQGLSVSAIQLAVATSAIANGGKLMKPYIVKSIARPDGKKINTFSPHVVNTVISAKTADAIKNMMNSVVAEGGTGSNAAIKNYERILRWYSGSSCF